MLTDRIKKVMKNYNEIINAKKGTVGSLFKHHRRNKNFTLEELSEGICSLSYLCKVERNQIIPNNHVIKEISKRLEIEEYLVIDDDNNNDEWVKQIILEKRVDENLFKNICSNLDYRSKLISYSYYLLNKKDLKESYHLYIDLLEYYEHFTKMELLLYIYIVFNHFYYEGKYLEVSKLYYEFKFFEVDEKIDMDLRNTLIKSLFKSGRNIDALSIVDETLKLYFFKLKHNDIAWYKQYELIAKSNSISKDELENNLKLIENNKYINEKLIWFNYYFFNEKNYNKALNSIKKIKGNEEYFNVLYLFTLSKLGLKDIISIELEVIINSNKDYKYDYIYNYFLNKNTIDNQSKVIKELLYAQTNNSNDQLKQIIFSELVDFCLSNKLYKLCVEILTRENHILKEKTSVILKNN